MPDHVASQRDLQRARTHRAIADAAYELAVEVGYERVTADAIADRAGVSRRTLFNYFPSVDAAIAAPAQEFLDAAREALVERPLDEPIRQACTAALTAAATPDRVRRFGEFLVLAENNEAAARFHLASWDEWEQSVADSLLTRLPAAEPLFVRVLAAAVIGAGRAAVKEWAADARAMRLEPPRPDALTAYLIQAIGYLTPAVTAHPTSDPASDPTSDPTASDPTSDPDSTKD